MSSPDTPVRLIGYLRVSTAEQASSGLGLEAQKAIIENAAKINGWEIIHWEDDAGISGTERNRPGLLRSLEYVNNKLADGIVTSHLSRFSRNAFHLMELMTTAETNNWRFIALDLSIDTMTPHGRFVATVMSALVQFVRDQISENTKEALAAKKARGEPVGRPMKTDESVMQLVYSMLDQGMSQNAVARTLTHMGIPTTRGGEYWSQSTIAWMVERRRRIEKEKALVGGE